MPNEPRVVRLYLAEDDRWGHDRLWKRLLERAREHGSEGCSVLGAKLGFGRGRAIHSDFPPEQAVDLPVVITLVEKSDEGPTRERGERQTLLRIYFDESRKSGLEPLYWELLKRARDLGLAGCTVFRGIAGFGAGREPHRASLRHFLSADLPIVVEIVDTEPRVRGFLEAVRPLLHDTLVTQERVLVRHCHSLEEALPLRRRTS